MKRNVTTIALLLFCFCASIVSSATTRMETFIAREQQAYKFTPVTNLFHVDEQFRPDETNVWKQVKKAQFIAIDKSALAGLLQSKYKGILLSIPTANGNTYQVDLAQFSFLTSDFVVQENASGAIHTTSYKPGVYYRGIVDNIPGSIAAFSFFNNELYGGFSIPGVGNYVLVPNNYSGDSTTEYALYNDADLVAPPDWTCGTDGLPKMGLPNTNRTTAFADEKVYSTCNEVKVYIKADYETYKKRSSNTATTVNYLTSVFNYTSTLYRNEGVYTTIKTVEVNTATDAYQSLGKDIVDFLNTFGTETQNNLQGANVAVLASARYPGMGGVAVVGTLCGSYYVDNSSGISVGPYAACNIRFLSAQLPTYSWDVNVITHEMGHVLGSEHTHNCSWPGGAIDGCAPLEDGPCTMPNPQYPPGGGTMMSYCHLQSVGVNFSNGFGPLPGGKIRQTIAANACTPKYMLTTPLSTGSIALSANRECTDPYGYTYYWNDNNTADPGDDQLAMMVLKKTVDIGNLDDLSFIASTTTTSNYGAHFGIPIKLPAAITTPYAQNYAMQHYWQLTTSKQPTANVEIILPFSTTDMNDMQTTVNLDTSFLVYNRTDGGNAKPADFSGLSTNDIKMLTHSDTASITKWAYTSTGGTSYAHFLSSSSTNGCSIFFSPIFPQSVNNVIANAPISVYPNPTKSEWMFVMPKQSSTAYIHLYSADGKMIQQQLLEGGKTNRINAAMLPAGIYFFRITGDNVYTRTLTKE